MKTILVDAVDGIVSDTGILFQEMYDLLEMYPNPKIIVTGANDEQYEKFGLDQMPYEVFTLKHDPEKTDPKYFEILLEQYNLTVKDVIYFEHKKEAVESAKSIGIISYHYNSESKDLVALKNFLDTNI